MRKNNWLCGWLRVVCLVTLVLAGIGCQRFDAAGPLRKEIGEQATEFRSSTDAFLRWCVDESTGNPDSWGP